jgi:hypothetical protein
MVAPELWSQSRTCPRPLAARTIAGHVTTILVVDDSATMRRMIMTALRDLGEVTFDEAASRRFR